MEMLEGLNDAQKAAAGHIEGPMMVVAGAGSGKTRVLTHRIAHLIDQGVDPFSILALTFTNKAAREMKGRIGQIVGEADARNIWMGTFHSVFARILRIESERINYPSNFTIYDTQDSRSVIKDVIKSLGLDDKLYKPNSIHGRISGAKNNLIGPQDYAANPDIMGEDQQAGRPRIAEIYAGYNLRLQRSGAMDFDDLLFKTNVLLRDFPDLLHKYQQKFAFILVDEYQDTNFAQYLIIRQLGAARENVCVVGDDAQSIYSFRGANIQNILNFQRDYPDCVVYKLEQNYRSTKTIVEAANTVIAKNQDQIRKEVWTGNADGDKIDVHRALSDNDEGSHVADGILTTRSREQARHQDFAILYRTNAQSRAFEEQLRKRNIPYRIYGGLSFYQRKEIKDLIAYFRLTANPADDESFKRVVNYPARGIGKTTMDRLTVAAANHECALWDVLQDPLKKPEDLKGAAWGKLQDFATMISGFATRLETASAFDLGHHIAQHTALLRELHKDKTPEGVARYENVEELLAGMKEFSDTVDPANPDALRTMGDFLVDVALLTDADQDDGDDDKVSLMTIHAAKGLEFPYIYVVGLEENLFPSQMALNTREELEEERRLFYVALTRAEKRATLSYALTRYRWGQLIQNEPSRFIEEIDEQYLNLPTVSARRPEPFDFNTARTSFYKPMPSGSGPRTTTQPKPGMKKVSASAPGAAAESGVAPASSGGIAPGVEVKHARFGKGKVLKLEGEEPNVKATVFFPSAGQKQLLLKFAKLEVLG
ncbi:MAG: UvrD-helicase domain-containing protein [Bacteroidota bacterium]|jgi:DNA helicase-2/ATP-dependent DNA helicase PcrA|nr:UvrD-helicase domain-containing protein [Bacteroidota bacterium]